MTIETGLSATLWRASEADWRAIVAKALDEKGSESLVSYSDDDLAIGPIYRPADDGKHIWRRCPQEPWIVVQRVDDPNQERATKILDADLTGGATGIEFVFDGSASANRTGFGLSAADIGLLEKLPPERNLDVRLDAGAASFEYYRRLNTARPNVLTLSFDPLAEAAARGGFDKPAAEIECDLARTAADFRDTELTGCPVVADGRIWGAGGASEAQEIAGVLGSIVHSLHVLTGAGFSPREGLDSIGLVADAGPNKFLTVAKIRALRLCHARLVEAFGLTPLNPRLHVETSWRMMTRYDMHTNILRSTNAAFAAGIAGADSVTVLPHNLAAGIPDLSARRLARNVQIILLEEAGLARVDDPAAGAGAVEALTKAIAETAWAEFRKLETAGGLAAALGAGTFQTSIAKTRERRNGKIARREIAITGVSSFSTIEQADTGAIAALRESKSSPKIFEGIPRLQATRFSEPFEALRDRAAELAGAGRPPTVFLARLGNATEPSDAAQRVTNLFAAGGVSLVDVGAFATPAEAARAFSVSGARAACIIGGQDLLHRHAIPTARALKDSGCARVYVMGATETGNTLDAMLGDNVDVIAILDDVLTLCM